MNYNLTDPYEIAKFIKESKKSTPVKVYINGNLDGVNLENIEVYGSNNFYVLYGESEKISDVILNNKDRIKNFRVENDRRNSAIPMLDLLAIDARIEPGAIIRDLGLRRPIYKQTAAYGHFGRHDLNLPWEQLNKVEEIKKFL